MIIINFTHYPIIKAEVMIMIIKTADRIKSSRENLAVTQAELARKLSVTRACVNAWEMGISIPSSERMVELAEVLNVSTDFLFGKDDTDTLDLSGLTDEERYAIRNIVNIMKGYKK